MSIFTSSLPKSLLQLLDEKAKELGLPKDKLIEEALVIYLEELNKVAYTQSYQRMSNDDSMMIAEEGMEDYLPQLQEKGE